MLKAALGPYRAQGCNSEQRKISPYDALSAKNIKAKADVYAMQLIGLRQELEVSEKKNHAIEAQLKIAYLHIIIGSGDQRCRIQETEFHVKAQRIERRRLKVDLNKQRLFVKSES